SAATLTATGAATVSGSAGWASVSMSATPAGALLVVGAFDAFGIDRAAVFLAAAATAAATTATLALGIGTRFGAGVGIGVDTVDAVGILGHGSLLIAAGGFGHRQGRGSGGRR
ncbi:hypothetical protein, partial [Bordetella pertussis]|uniref:hypothetical protein n=1 Tax=Bordetella pertussis TaxID=520 RepID=UPI0018A7996D